MTEPTNPAAQLAAGGAARRVWGVLAGPLLQIWLLVAAVAGAAVALAVLVIPGLSAGSAAPAVPWLVLALGFAVADLVRVHLHVRGEAHTFTLAELPLVVGLLFAAPLEMVLAQVLGALVVRLVAARQAPVKVAFNVAVAAVDGCVAVMVFRLLTDSPDPSDLRTWVAVAAATVLTSLVSSLLVATAIAVSERSVPSGVLTQTTGPAVAVTLVNTTLALAFAVVLSVQPVSAWLLLAPTVLVVLGYRAYARHAEDRQRVEFLLASGRTLNSDGDIADRVRSGLELCRDALRARRVELVLYADLGRPMPGRMGMAGRSLTALARCAQAGTVVLHRKEGVTTAADAPLAALQVRQAVVTPVRRAGEVVGALVALDRVGEVSLYSERDTHLLEAVSEQVTVALERHGLTAALRRVSEVESSLRHQAGHDPLTGLPNRRTLSERLATVLARRRTSDRAPALLLLDLDAFKPVNDRYGHGVGDQVLRIVADRLRGNLRPGDLAARLGGDEFVVLLDEPLTPREAAELAARVLADVTGPATVAGHPIDIRVSLGFASATAEVTTPTDLLKRADAAMYASKRAQVQLPQVEAAARA